MLFGAPGTARQRPAAPGSARQRRTGSAAPGSARQRQAAPGLGGGVMFHTKMAAIAASPGSSGSGPVPETGRPRMPAAVDHEWPAAVDHG